MASNDRNRKAEFYREPIQCFPIASARENPASPAVPAKIRTGTAGLFFAEGTDRIEVKEFPQPSDNRMGPPYDGPASILIHAGDTFGSARIAQIPSMAAQLQRGRS